MDQETDRERLARLYRQRGDLLAELQTIIAGWEMIERGRVRGRTLTDWEKERLSFARAVIRKATDESEDA